MLYNIADLIVLLLYNLRRSDLLTIKDIYLYTNSRLHKSVKCVSNVGNKYATSVSDVGTLFVRNVTYTGMCLAIMLVLP